MVAGGKTSSWGAQTSSPCALMIRVLALSGMWGDVAGSAPPLRCAFPSMTRSSVPGVRNVLRICLRIWLPPGCFKACSSTLVSRRPGFRGCFAFGHKGREAAQKARKRVFLRLLVVRHFRPIALLLAQYTVGRHAPDFVLTFSRFFSSVYSFAAAFSYRCAASSGAVRSLF